jgi:hypothetical protein
MADQQWLVPSNSAQRCLAAWKYEAALGLCLDSKLPSPSENDNETASTSFLCGTGELFGFDAEVAEQEGNQPFPPHG